MNCELKESIIELQRSIRIMSDKVLTVMLIEISKEKAIREGLLER